MSGLADFEKACFVIMPFGKKPVEGKTVDFDQIYEKIFRTCDSGRQDAGWRRQADRPSH